jgi:hypothetical protein
MGLGGNFQDIKIAPKQMKELHETSKGASE